MYDINILILEDEALIATNLQEKFEFWGYKVPVIVSSKKEVLKIAEYIKPDLALIDLELNDKEGVMEIAGKLNNDFGTAVLYMLSFFNEETMKFVRLANHYGVLLKPFEENQIKYKVEETLYKRKLFRSLIASK